MKPSKYNPVVRGQLVELASVGYTNAKIAYYMNISLRTLQLWLKKYPELKEDMNRAKTDSANDCIEVGLRKLAQGSNDKVTTNKFITNKRIKRIELDEASGEEIERIVVIPVERTEVIKEHRPDPKAIEILARKYAKEFDSKNKEESTTINILEGFTMRELQEARKNNVIDAIETTASIVDDNDINSLESNDDVNSST